MPKQPTIDDALHDIESRLMQALGILRACIVANEASDDGELELTYPMEAAADLVHTATEMLDQLTTPAGGRALKLAALSMGHQPQPSGRIRALRRWYLGWYLSTF